MAARPTFRSNRPGDSGRWRRSAPARRERVAGWYSERLARIEGVTLPRVAAWTSRMSWFVYVVRLAPGGELHPVVFQAGEQPAHEIGIFAALDQQSPGAWGEFGKAGALTDAPFVSPIANFYMTDPISRASRTMAQCTDEFVLGSKGGSKKATGTHG